MLKSGKFKGNLGGWSKNVKIWEIVLVFSVLDMLKSGKLKGNLGDDRKMSKFGQFAFYFWTDFWLFSLKIRYLQLKSGKLKANFGGWSKNVKIWNIYLVFLAKFRNLLLKPFLIEILKSCCPCGARCFVYLQSQLTQ